MSEDETETVAAVCPKRPALPFFFLLLQSDEVVGVYRDTFSFYPLKPPADVCVSGCVFVCGDKLSLFVAGKKYPNVTLTLGSSPYAAIKATSSCSSPPPLLIDTFFCFHASSAASFVALIFSVLLTGNTQNPELLCREQSHSVK